MFENEILCDIILYNRFSYLTYCSGNVVFFFHTSLLLLNVKNEICTDRLLSLLKKYEEKGVQIKRMATTIVPFIITA